MVINKASFFFCFIFLSLVSRSEDWRCKPIIFRVLEHIVLGFVHSDALPRST